MDRTKNAVALATAGSAIVECDVAPPQARTKPTRYAVEDALLAAFCADFWKHSAELIKRLREKRPATYMKTMLQLVPKQPENPQSAMDAIGDEEFDTLVAAARRALEILENPEGEDLDPGQSSG
jgi:hypothetical protein